MNVAQLLVRCLESEGVELVFGVPGEENEEVLFALEDSSIRFVPTRHEQGAAFMANVWGRLTGRAGVCLATLGPGATNLVTGVADANLDKSPVVALTAQGGTDRLHHESHQYLDIVAMFEPITKWNGAISGPEVVTEMVRKAFKLAEIEKPGATHIELSEDLAALEVPEGREPIARRAVRRPGPDYRAIDQTLELLRQARRPLVLAGNGAIRKRSSRHLTEFVTRHGIPATSTFMGKGAVSDKSEQSLWSIGLGFEDFALEAFEKADLVLAVGYDIAEYDPQSWNPTGETRVVHIDFQPAEVYDHYHPQVEVVCDISAALWELNERLAGESLKYDPDWYAPIRRRIVEDVGGYELGDGDAFTIPGALNVIRRVLPDEGLMISDVGSHKMWIARNFPTYCPNGCLISNGLASMGISLPGGVAAAMADPERPVISAMGDGGFLMNSQELETARRVGAGFAAIVFNDNDYGLISWKQERSRGRSVSTRISNPDLVRYGESFGIEAFRPESASELEERLTDVLENRRLCLIEIPVETGVNGELVEKLSNYWKRRRAEEKDA